MLAAEASGVSSTAPYTSRIEGLSAAAAYSGSSPPGGAEAQLGVSGMGMGGAAPGYDWQLAAPLAGLVAHEGQSFPHALPLQSILQQRHPGGIHTATLHNR